MVNVIFQIVINFKPFPVDGWPIGAVTAPGIVSSTPIYPLPPGVGLLDQAHYWL